MCFEEHIIYRCAESLTMMRTHRAARHHSLHAGNAFFLHGADRNSADLLAPGFFLPLGCSSFPSRTLVRYVCSAWKLSCVSGLSALVAMTNHGLAEIGGMARGGSVWPGKGPNSAASSGADIPCSRSQELHRSPRDPGEYKPCLAIGNVPSLAG